MILIMPKNHGYRIIVGVFQNIFLPSLLMCYRSLLTAHMIALPPYGSTSLFVNKKDKALRMVLVDYHALNDQTIKNGYLILRIADLFDQLANIIVFSSLDLTQGYHHDSDL